MNNTSDLTNVQGPDTTVEVTSSAKQSIIGFVLAHLPSFLYRLVTFATITIPLFFYRVLTWSFTLHLNFTSIVVILGFVATCTWLIVRYRFLTTYSRLKPIQPPKPASSFDLHPDAAEDQEYIKSGLKSYPDEFLSAFLSSIKVFGYLEQPVFHELARHLQTRRLLAGDTLFKNPEQERSFYIVVDGNVQVFIKPNNTEVNSDDEDDLNASDTDEYGNERLKNHTLLNEVGAGGTLSSLFTILSLFSECTDKPAKTKQKPSGQYRHYAGGEELSRDGSQESWGQVFRKLDQADLDVGFIEGVRPKSDLRSPPLTYNQLEQDDLSDLGDEPDVRITDNTGYSKEDSNHISRSSMKPARMKKAAYRQQRSVHPGIIARATVDTTLAVIPAEAFHKLTQKFPKAAAHIVQVILTRFQRVTFLTGHKYLGLTKELLRAERLANESASLDTLPDEFFIPGGLNRLRHKFVKEDKPFSIGSDNGDDHKTSSTSDSGNDHPSIIQTMNISERISPSPSVDSSPNSNLNIPVKKSVNGHTRRGSVTRNNSDFSIEDDRHLKASVMACVSQSLGLRTFASVDHTPTHSENGINRSPPVSHLDLGKSRHHYPMDLFSHAGVIDDSGSPSFGPISMPTDDIEIMSSTSSVSNSEHNFEPRFGSNVSANDVQILYYPKDAVLVKEGEHNRGLFFVIDGSLEVSMSPIDGEDQPLPTPMKTSHSNSSRNNKRRRSSALRRTVNRPTSYVDDPFAQAQMAPSPDDYVDKKKVAEPNEAQQRRTVMSDAPAGRSYDGKDSKDNGQRTKKPLFSIKAGGMAGYLAALSGYPSFVEIRAATDTFVGYITKQTLERIVDRNPIVMLTLAKRLISILSPLILHMDFALEWVQVPAGQIIYRQGEPSNSIYIVLNGRLRTISERKEGGIDILGEFGHGDSVGELEVLTGTSTPSTLHAIRDTELARMPKTLFNALAIRHPEITLQISRMIALRSRQLVIKSQSPQGVQVPTFNLSSKDNSPVASLSSTFSNNKFPELFGRNNVNLKTVGIIPVSSSVPVTAFAESLRNALVNSVGAETVLLNSATIMSVMGKHAFSRMGKLKLTSWLAEQEEKARIVLYLADGGVTSQWTRTCIRQADCILLVGLGDGDPSVGEYERFLINMKTTARKELVLLHGEKYCASGTTQEWLKNRLWIQAHHHIFMPMRQHLELTATRQGAGPAWLRHHGRKVTAGSINMLINVKGQIEKYYSAVRVPSFGRLLDLKKTGGGPISGVSSSTRNDFARLARRLCGKSVALVLGGGGARGISHMGVIQAIEEAGIPIDIIGGTSIGSFVGGLYAKNSDLVSTMARAKMFSGRVASLWRQLMDLTYPVTAWTTGHEFNRALWKCFGDSQIEDFWLPYFVVTTNITYSRMEVHTTGYAWRYVRASMSLSGYMPPICDNGNMLVDGGYMDNLPVTVAKSMGADIIIAVDVASEDDTSPVLYGDSLSGWWALLQAWNPFRTYKIPSIADIQSRLAYVSSVAKLEEAKMTDGTLYIKLPVQKFGTLEFGKFHDIFSIGYDAGKELANNWRKYATGRLEHGDKHQKGTEVKGNGGRRNSI
ncbi:phosphatidylcholine and lysophosphatidylcholine phospholipase [Umbelopsis nana]